MAAHLRHHSRPTTVPDRAWNGSRPARSGTEACCCISPAARSCLTWPSAEPDPAAVVTAELTHAVVLVVPVRQAPGVLVVSVDVVACDLGRRFRRQRVVHRSPFGRCPARCPRPAGANAVECDGPDREPGALRERSSPPRKPERHAPAKATCGGAATQACLAAGGFAD